MTLALLDRPAPPVDAATRREFLIGGLSLAALLVACGNGDEASAPSDSGDGRFPVTIEHKYGSTVIPVQPKRVATVGLIEQDALLALGVVPIATTEWFGDHPGAIHPWARDALGAATLPAILRNSNTDGIQFERIAALQPDLILALYNVPATESDYGRLAQIAPTVVQPAGLADAASVSWQELTRTVGRAVGQPQRAAQLVTEVEARFAEARNEHPEFARAAAVMVAPTGDGNYDAYPPPDLGGEFLATLGFEVPSEIAELAGGQSFATISGERLDLLDTDLLVWLVENESQQDEIRDNPLYAGLEVATQGRDVFLNFESDRLADAASFQTVLSLPFLVDGLVPMLAAAVDGDPTTKVPS